MAGSITIDPGPKSFADAASAPAYDWTYFVLDRLRYHGKDLTILWDKPDGQAHYSGYPEGFSLYIDGKLAAVEYGEPEDIVELQTSINVARITPEGEQPQNSNAYICGVRSGGAVHVYVALHLLQSGRLIIYVPEEQPAGETAVRETLRGAVGFAEAVGFMMDPVTLNDDPAARRETIKRVPALKARGV